MGQIGFVSHIWIVGQAVVGVNWVRFAEIGGGEMLGMLKLGSFRIFGRGGVCLESPLAMLIEQVPRLWAAALRSAARRSG